MTPEEIRECLTGPIASLKTPFLQDGSIDYPGMRNYVDFVIEAGSKSVVITAGDSLLTILTDDEIAEVTRVVVEQTASRAMVVAADRYFGTPQSVEFAKYVREVGADILMALPPDWASSSTLRTLADHYINVSQHIPVMLVTNIFAPRGEQFGLEVLQILREEAPGVVAIKDDICGVFARKMAVQFNDHWPILSGGQKQNHLDLIHYGCDSYLSTFIDFCPEIAQRYWQAIQANDLEAAKNIIRDYDMPLWKFIMDVPGGFDAAVHGAMELFGVTQRWRRPPYYSFTDEDMEKLSDLFKEISLL